MRFSEACMIGVYSTAEPKAAVLQVRAAIEHLLVHSKGRFVVASHQDSPIQVTVTFEQIELMHFNEIANTLRRAPGVYRVETISQAQH